MVNWDDHTDMISTYFSVGEALLLKSWSVYHIPSEDEKANILDLAQRLDTVRERIGNAFIVHAWIRPTSVNCPGSNYDQKNYNQFIGSTAKNSGHITGQAVDFHVSGSADPNGCQQMKRQILPWLEELGLRMEDNVGGNWIHLDTKPVISKRFFTP